MNLAQLYYFRTLAKFEHYGKAAEALYITQPSLSNSIKNLEKEIGVPFFERVGRNVRLTEYGEEFNKHICCALDEIDKAVEIMKAYNSGLSGRIRIGTVSAFSVTISLVCSAHLRALLVTTLSLTSIREQRLNALKA